MLYIAEVPKISSNIVPQNHVAHSHSPVEMDKLYLKRDQLDSFVTEEIIMESTETTTVKRTFNGKLCDDGLCCTFSGDYDFKNTNSDKVMFNY